MEYRIDKKPDWYVFLNICETSILIIFNIIISIKPKILPTHQLDIKLNKHGLNIWVVQSLENYKNHSKLFFF